MLEFTRSRESTPAIKVVGLGGAGSNVVDRLIIDGFDSKKAAILNTDVQALNASATPEKIHIGKATTRGLGAGGDPEVGFAAADEAAPEISSWVGSSGIVFLCAGLGGGTGSGAAPLVAHLARKAGATVVALVTLPFHFEGKRRVAQAQEALSQLEQQADMVLCFENDAMASLVPADAGIQQAFTATDQMLSQAISAFMAILERRGLVNIGLDDLAAALGRSRSGSGVRCYFGSGESDSSIRAREAIDRALQSPLMAKGLSEAQHVLVHVAGGPELTLNEVSLLMEEFHRHVSENTQVSFGVGTDAKLAQRLSVSILCSTAAVPSAPAAPKAAPQALPVPELNPVEKRVKPVEPPKPAEPDFFPAADLPPQPEPQQELQREEDPRFESFEDEEPVEETLVGSEPERAPEPPPQVITPAVKKYAPASAVAASVAKTGKKEERAEQMTLEPANRGRFEKSEPTIVDGEDLDVPTFLRKNNRR